MVSNSTKEEIRHRIQGILGNLVEYPHGIMAQEITYIVGLTGDYQELAILQAALGQLVAKNIDHPLQAALRAQITNLATKLQEQEVKAYNSKQAWADKYGNFHYIKKGDKVAVSIDVKENAAEIVLPEVECKLCVDGKILDAYGKSYPCECALGDKWAKKTDYMGPTTPVPYGPKTGFQPKVVPIDKFGGLNTQQTTGGLSGNKTASGIAAMQAQAQAKYEEYTKVTNVTYGSKTSNITVKPSEIVEEFFKVATAPITAPVTTPAVRETEEPKGRRFKEKI